LQRRPGVFPLFDQRRQFHQHRFEGGYQAFGFLETLQVGRVFHVF